MTKMKLFTFPFAGGSSMYYYGWKKKLNPSIEVIPIELAGRGMRHKETLMYTFQETIDDVYKKVMTYLQDEKQEVSFAFFGHSMGSLIAFHLSHVMEENAGRVPSILFLSGRWPPHVARNDFIDIHLSDEELKMKLFDLGGISLELFDNKEFLDLMLTIVRADFQMMSTYEYTDNEVPLSTPIHVLTGIKDYAVNKPDLAEWRQHTTGEFSIQKFKGGHFYITDSSENVLHYINRTLLEMHDIALKKS